ncbi:hypothetical protein NGUA15_04188 [Salmonella enterica]|nr:hypothetical protein NGUA15_04188 [Salmonella enterica]
MCTDGIRQHQRVAVLAVLKPPVDAPLLHQSLKKIKISFTVLYLPGAYRVAFHQSLFHRIRILSQHFIENIHHGFILECLVVAGVGQQFYPRLHTQLIGNRTPFMAHHPRRRDQPADMPFAAAIQFDVDAQIFAHHGFKRQVGCGGDIAQIQGVGRF